MHLVGVSGVTLRGLQDRAGEAARGQPTSVLALVTWPGPGIVLDRLDLDGGGARVNGVEMWGPLGDYMPGGPGGPADCAVRGCFTASSMGLTGKYSEPMTVGACRCAGISSRIAVGLLLRGWAAGSRWSATG